MWKRIQLCSPRKKQKPSCSKRGTTYLSGVSGTGGVRQLIFRFGVSIDLRSKLTPGRTLVSDDTLSNHTHPGQTSTLNRIIPKPAWLLEVFHGA